jgi:putative sigma-54 modulation protein
MEIHMTGRHVRVTPAVRRRLAERLDKLTRYIPELAEAHVKLSAEKYRHIAEILIHVRHEDHVARAEAAEPAAAVEAACDRLEAQVRKLKEKKNRKPRRQPNGVLRRSAARVALEVPLGRTGRGNGRAAAPARDTAPRVLRDRLAAAKPISLAQAAERLDESGDDFVVFVDDVSGRPGVLYRRKDGQLALVEARD